MYWQDTSGATESLVGTAVINRANSILPKSRSAHYTGFYRDIQICLLQDRRRMSLENITHSYELSMSCALRPSVKGSRLSEVHLVADSYVQWSVGVVQSSANDFPIMNENTTYGCLITSKGPFCLNKSAPIPTTIVGQNSSIPSSAPLA